MAKKKVAKKSTKNPAPSGAEEHFVENLVIRGEAVKKKRGQQKLPPGATHWIVESKDKKASKVKRGRFSLI